MFDKVFSWAMQGVMYFGAFLLSGIMLLITVDVCLRYFFNNPIQGSYEIIEVLMGMLSPIVILYCAWKRGHVSVDLFFEKFPPAMQKFCAVLSSVLCLALWTLMTWRAVFLIQEMRRDDAMTNLLFIPWWPVGVVILICFALLTVIEVRELLHALRATYSEDTP